MKDFCNRHAPLLAVAALVLMCLTAFFVASDATPTDIMEQRNLVTAREMAVDGHWLVPTMNGELRLEKPPLPTWAAAVVECVSPDNLGAQRLVSAAMGSLWLVFLYLTALLLSGRRDYALVAAAVLATSYQVILMSRSATWDVWCHATMAAALYFLLRLLLRGGGGTLAGLCLGLSFMSKGPVSFYAMLLPALVALAVVWRPRLSRRQVWSLVWMVVVAVVVGGWWYATVYGLHPEVSERVIHKETGAWAGRNVRPWWYYWRFFAETGVWALLTLAAVVAAVRSWRGARRRRCATSSTLVFAVVYMLAAVVLLSLLPEKKMRYLLPLMSPCALAVAGLLVGWRDGRLASPLSLWCFRLHCYVVAVAAAAVPVVVGIATRRGVDAGTSVVAAVLAAAVAAWLVWCGLRRRVYGSVVGVVALFAVVEVLLLRAVGGAFGNPDAHSIALVRTDDRLADLPFYYPADRELRIELVAAARRTIRPLDVGDSVSVARALPFVIVVPGGGLAPSCPVDAVFTPGLAATLAIERVDGYDDNKHPPTDRHYQASLTSEVAIVAPLR